MDKNLDFFIDKFQNQLENISFQIEEKEVEQIGYMFSVCALVEMAFELILFPKISNSFIDAAIHIQKIKDENLNDLQIMKQKEKKYKRRLLKVINTICYYEK